MASAQRTRRHQIPHYLTSRNCTEPVPLLGGPGAYNQQFRVNGPLPAPASRSASFYNVQVRVPFGPPHDFLSDTQKNWHDLPGHNAVRPLAQSALLAGLHSLDSQDKHVTLFERAQRQTFRSPGRVTFSNPLSTGWYHNDTEISHLMD